MAENSSSSQSGSSSSSSGSNKSSSSSSKSSGGSNKRSSASNNGQKEPVELARAAVQTLAMLTGHAPESVLGLRRGEEGWQVLVEVLEMQRVPNSTDLLGCYAVELDKDGEVVGYQRQRRYQRGQTGGDDQ